jgi:integrase
MAHVDGLSALKVQREKRPGMQPDGYGLYLRISESGARSWVLRYTLHGRRHDIGLGSAHDVSLTQARERAHLARELKARGIDPLGAKRAHIATARAAEAKAVTFKDAAAAYIASKRAGWRSVQHAAQWQQSISDYVLPVIGDLPVSAIDMALVLKVLQPIWETKTETASRVRNRIELVLDWATVSGYREGDNPARWRGRLDKILPTPSKVHRKEHHDALPYREVPAFMAELYQRKGNTYRALTFTVLTAVRTNEVCLTTAADFDLSAATWTISGDRMKGGREHRVPLSAPALALVDDAIAYTSKDAMGKVIKNLRPVTVHGFRSSFRDGAAEQTSFPGEVVEMALAHAIPNAVEAAYRRGDLFEKRKQLMDEWAAFCIGSCSIRS